MKKVLFSALLGLLISASSFANKEDNVNYTVKSSFRFDFNNVSDVKWSTTASFATASFVMDNKMTRAFYNNDGTLIGTSQAITIDQLPASAKRAFTKKYTDYTVTEAIKFETNEETAYFISAKSEEKNVIFKVAKGQVSIFK